MHLHAEWCEQFCNGTIALPREWRVIARHEEIDVAYTACGAQFANQSRKCRCGRTLQLNEIRAEGAQAGGELCDALTQEPGAVRAGAGASDKAWLPDEDRQEGCAAILGRRYGRHQGGVVGEAKVSAEPKDHWGVQHRRQIIAPRPCRGAPDRGGEGVRSPRRALPGSIQPAESEGLCLRA